MSAIACDVGLPLGVMGGSKFIPNDLRSRWGVISKTIYIFVSGGCKKIIGGQIRGDMLCCAYAIIQVAWSGAMGSKSGNEICSDYGGAFNQADKTSGGMMDMRNIFRGCLLLLCIMAFPLAVQASPLGIAAEYNVFMVGLGDLNLPPALRYSIKQSSTDVEGRVAAAGNVYYGRPPNAGENINDTGFAVASKISHPNPLLPDLVAGGNLELKNGSVGDKNNQQGIIYAGGTVDIGNNSNVDYIGHGPITTYNPINFEAEKNNLRNLSSLWGSLAPTGKVETPNSGQVIFTGGNPDLNIFNWDTSDLGTGLGFFLNVPIGSTVLINIADSDNDVELVNAGFYIAKNFMPKLEDYIPQNDAETIAKYYEGDTYEGFPNSKILFNFPGITDLYMDYIEINGSILAPWADIFFGQDSHIDGHLIGMNLSGNGESHNIRFDGKIPVPEPSTLILLGSGLAGIAALRRRMKS